MRLSFRRKETQRGLFRQQRLYWVTTTVGFTNAELGVITENKLHPHVVLERAPSAHWKDWAKADPDWIERAHLTIATLLNGPDDWAFLTPMDANQYEDAVRTALEDFKDTLTLSQAGQRSGVGRFDV